MHAKAGLALFGLIAATGFLITGVAGAIDTAQSRPVAVAGAQVAKGLAFRPHRARRAAISKFTCPFDTKSLYGCKVQTAPKYYLIFWGDWSKAPHEDKLHVKPLMEWFAEHLQASTWLDTITQYNVPSSDKEYDPKKNLYEDTTNPIPGNPLSNTELQAEVTKMAEHFAPKDMYNINNLFIIALPKGVTTTWWDENCAEHNFIAAPEPTPSPPAVNGIPYAVIPYQPDDTEGCRGFAITLGPVGKGLDNVGSAMGHEIAEAQTDPVCCQSYGDLGWINAATGQNEIADVCQDIFQTVDVGNDKGSRSEPMQSLFSNSTADCAPVKPARISSQHH
jgi:hypothetical protein